MHLERIGEWLRKMFSPNQFGAHQIFSACTLFIAALDAQVTGTNNSICTDSATTRLKAVLLDELVKLDSTVRSPRLYRMSADIGAPGSAVTMGSVARYDEQLNECCGFCGITDKVKLGIFLKHAEDLVILGPLILEQRAH